jgi:hypothetical protein
VSVFGLPAQWIAILRAVAFIIGLIIGPGVPGVTTQTPDKPAATSSPLAGLLGTLLMGGALALPAGEKNDTGKLKT